MELTRIDIALRISGNGLPQPSGHMLVSRRGKAVKSR